MIYLIGGVSCGGKSALASYMLAQHQIPWLSIDGLRSGFQYGFPAIGIHHDVPDLVDAEKLGPFLFGLIEQQVFDGRDYLIEGVCLLISDIRKFADNWPGQIGACVVGYPNIEIDKKFESVRSFNRANDWTKQKSDPELISWIQKMKNRSVEYQSRCKGLGIPFVDTGVGDFHTAIELAAASLFENPI